MKLQREAKEEYGLKVYKFSITLTSYIKLEVGNAGNTNSSQSSLHRGVVNLISSVDIRNVSRSVFRSQQEKKAFVKGSDWDTHAKSIY